MSLSNFLLAYFIAQFFKILSIIEPDSKIPNAYKKGAQHSRNSRSQQESCIALEGIKGIFPWRVLMKNYMTILPAFLKNMAIFRSWFFYLHFLKFLFMHQHWDVTLVKKEAGRDSEGLG